MAQKVAQTHTGGLTGSDGIQDTLFKKLGVIRVDDLDQPSRRQRLWSDVVVDGRREAGPG